MSRPSGSSSSALPFIQSDAAGRFFLQPAAMRIIAGIKGKICPVVVAGPYRTGKSTLLNLLLDTNVSGGGSGFAVGGSVQACTKGMWLWSAPVTVDGVTYIFIDSEGLGSTDQHATFDTQIFSLSILLSSLFILNTAGTINENALEQLELVVQMTDRIRVKEEAKKSKEEQSLASLAQFFPAFLWILRDFTLDLQNARGDPITSSEYLEEALRPVPIGTNSKKGAAEKNRIRSAISTVFPNRHCVTMVRPVTEERDLKRVSTIGSQSLRSEFTKQIEHLKAFIPQLAQPKTVEGVELNGRAFVAIAQNYVDAINSGGIPTIRTAFQSVQEIQGREAMDAALESATKALRDTIEAKGDKFIMADEDLESLLGDIQTAALELIREQGFGSASDLHELCQHFLTKHLAGLFQSVRDRNTHRAEKSFSATVEGLWDESGIEAHLPEYTSYKQLNSDVSGFWTKYLQLTKGQGSKQSAIEIGRTFLDKKREIIFKTLFDKIAVAGQELAAEKKTTAELGAKLKQATEEVQELKQERTINQKRVELEMGALQKENEKQQKENDKLHDKMTKECDKLQKLIDDADRRARSSEERALADRAALERQLSDAQRSSSAQIASVQAQLAATQAELAETNAELKSANKEQAKLEKSLATAEKSLAATEKSLASTEKSLAAAHAESTAAAAGATKHTSTLQSRVRSLEADLAAKESAFELLQDKFANFQSSHKTVDQEREREIHAKEKQIKTLEKQLSAAGDGADARVQQHEKEAAKAQREATALQREVDTLQQKLARAEAKVATAEAKATSAEAAAAAAASKAAAAAAAASSAASYSNPLGLPAPTAGPLVSRKSVIPSSFSSSSKSGANGKRKSSPVVEEDDDYEMAAAPADDDEDDGPDSDAESDRRRSMSAAAASAAAAARDLKDPASLSINQLKSWLTSLDIEFPQKAQPKTWYIDLIYQSIGAPLEQAYPRGAAKPKKAKK